MKTRVGRETFFRQVRGANPRLLNVDLRAVAEARKEKKPALDGAGGASRGGAAVRREKIQAG